MVTFASLFRGKERLLQKRVESAVELELRAWYLEAINEQFAAVCRYLTTMVQRYILSIHTHTQENILLHSLWTVWVSLTIRSLLRCWDRGETSYKLRVDDCEVIMFVMTGWWHWRKSWCLQSHTTTRTCNCWSGMLVVSSIGDLCFEGWLVLILLQSAEEWVSLQSSLWADHALSQWQVSGSTCRLVYWGS